MKIQKVINNNVISALDEGGQEIVAMGRGIGFQKKAGEELAESAVEKVFRWSASRFRTGSFPMPRSGFRCG